VPLNNSLKEKLDAAGVTEDQRRKLNALIDDLSGLESCLVAYSGGVDSAFLAYLASRVSGLKMEAVTLDTPLATPGELEAGSAFTAAHGIPHQTVKVDPLSIGLIRSNPIDRCYHCKKVMLEKVWNYATMSGFLTVLEGENADDLTEHRPGRRAVRESGARSPLATHGFTKNDIRALSRAFGLSTWDKPSSPCLATRIPYGTPITRESLDRIARAESYLHEKGFSIARVRCRGNLASVEVDSRRIGELSAMENDLRAAFQIFGFEHTSIDSRGYRSGSLDEGIHL
jgi:uncharacterized protein